MLRIAQRIPERPQRTIPPLSRIQTDPMESCRGNQNRRVARDHLIPPVSMKLQFPRPQLLSRSQIDSLELRSDNTVRNGSRTTTRRSSHRNTGFGGRRIGPERLRKASRSSGMRLPRDTERPAPSELPPYAYPTRSVCRKTGYTCTSAPACSTDRSPNRPRDGRRNRKPHTEK